VQLPVDLAVQVPPPLLVHEVPLVIGDDQGPPRLDDHRDDPQVLLRERLAGVDEDHGDLGAVQRTGGAQRRVVVRALVLAEPPSDAGRIDKTPRRAAELDKLVHRVPRGARYRVDQRALVADELVQQAGLADVRLAEERDAPRAVLLLVGFGRRVGQRVEDQVEQVTAAPPVQCADGRRLAQAELPQRRDV